LPMVRRATGGGAIVHHHDLTYALAVPQASSRVGAAPAIYNAVHSAVVEWLSDMGLAAQQWREPYNFPASAPPTRAPGKSEFLCFHRRSEGDVVVGDHKILGSAQRRNKEALLQHGSLLIATSPHAPTLSGLQEILPACGASLAKGRQFAEELLLRVQRAIDVLLGVRIKWNADLSREMYSLGTVKVAKFEAPAWQDRA